MSCPQDHSFLTPTASSGSSLNHPWLVRRTAELTESCYAHNQFTTRKGYRLKSAKGRGTQGRATQGSTKHRASTLFSPFGIMTVVLFQHWCVTTCEEFCKLGKLTEPWYSELLLGLNHMNLCWLTFFSHVGAWQLPPDPKPPPYNTLLDFLMWFTTLSLLPILLFLPGWPKTLKRLCSDMTSQGLRDCLPAADGQGQTSLGQGWHLYSWVSGGTGLAAEGVSLGEGWEWVLWLHE